MILTVMNFMIERYWELILMFNFLQEPPLQSWYFQFSDRNGVPRAVLPLDSSNKILSHHLHGTGTHKFCDDWTECYGNKRYWICGLFSQERAVELLSSRYVPERPSFWLGTFVLYWWVCCSICGISNYAQFLFPNDLSLVRFSIYVSSSSCKFTVFFFSGQPWWRSIIRRVRSLRLMKT